MKRILVVLLLVFAASLAFSVSGDVFTRILAGSSGPVYCQEDPWAIGTLLDQRVGRQGSGVDINFDSFTFTYKFRGSYVGTENGNYPVTDLGVLNANYNNNTGSAAKASSPGLIDFSGLKIGGFNFSIGATWWEVMQSENAVGSSSASGVTGLINANGNISYNCIALDATYNFSIGDIKFHADPWNRIMAEFWFGSDSYQSSGAGAQTFTWVAATTTNSASCSGYNVIIPIVIDWASGPFSATLETKWQFESHNNVADTLTSTNTLVENDAQLGGILKLNYTLSELWGVFGDVGLIYATGTQITAVAPATDTNEITYGGMFVPVMVGVALTPAPVFTVNFGLGWNIPVSYTYSTIDPVKGTTNVATFSTIPQDEWDFYQAHGYHHPFINLSADTKFAQDWGAGIRFLVYIVSTVGTGDNGPYMGENGGMFPAFSAKSLNNNGSVTYSVGTTTTTYTEAGYAIDWLTFNNLADSAWDGYGGSACYLSYAKDNFSVKCWLESTFGDTYATYSTGNQGLLGLFGAIDVGIKF